MAYHSAKGEDAVKKIVEEDVTGARNVLLGTLGFNPGGKKEDDPVKQEDDPKTTSATFADMMGDEGTGGMGGGGGTGYMGTGDFYQQQYRSYDLPDGWTWIPATGSQAEVFVGGIYISPDNKRFGDDGRGGPKGMDKDIYMMKYLDYVDVLQEATARANAEREKEEADAARKALEAADLEAYRQMLSRRKHEHASAKHRKGEEYLTAKQKKEAIWAKRQAFLDSQKGIRTKGDIARGIRQDQIDEWRKQGVDLGVLDPDFTPVPTRPTTSTSHVDDTVVATHGTSVPMHHNVDHEEFNVPAMTSSFLAAIKHAERPAQTENIVSSFMKYAKQTPGIKVV